MRFFRLKGAGPSPANGVSAMSSVVSPFEKKAEGIKSRIAISRPASGFNVYLTDEARATLGGLGRKINLEFQKQKEGMKITLSAAPKMNPACRQISEYYHEAGTYVGRITWSNSDLLAMGLDINTIIKADIDCIIHTDTELDFFLPDNSPTIKVTTPDLADEDGVDQYAKLNEAAALVNSFIVSTAVPQAEFWLCDANGIPIKKLERPFRLGVKVLA